MELPLVVDGLSVSRQEVAEAEQAYRAAVAAGRDVVWVGIFTHRIEDRGLLRGNWTDDVANELWFRYSDHPMYDGR